MRLRGLAILLLLGAGLAPGSSAAPQGGVAVGVYASNVPRFDRLTGDAAYRRSIVPLTR
jgi:hypothetical protein